MFNDFKKFCQSAIYGSYDHPRKTQTPLAPAMTALYKTTNRYCPRKGIRSKLPAIASSVATQLLR